MITKKVLWVMVMVVLSTVLIYSQENTGEILGKVTLAEEGSPLPGVTVTLTGTTFGKTSVVTSQNGNYRFWKLSPGVYNLVFELQGFKTVERTGIRLSLNQSLVLNVAMEPGSVEEKLTVIGEAPLIDTRKAQVSANYTSEMVSSLPVAMRTAEIINLAPGIMSALPQIAGQGSGTLHGFGVQNYRAEYYLDGASYRSTYGHGGMPSGIATARLEEVQVTTTGQDIANVQGGPTINFVSKRGGNRLAGEAYISLLDRSLQANHEGFPAYMKTLGYTENAGIFRTYDYGASLGGPIITDHLWFFGSWAVTDSWNKSYKGVPADRYYNPDMYGKINAQWKNFMAEFSYAHTDSAAVNVPWFTNSPNNLDRKNPGNTYTAQVSYARQKLLVSAKFTYFYRGTQTQQAGFQWTGAGNVSYEAGRTYNPPGRYYTFNYFKSPPYNTEPTGYWQHYGDVQKRPYLFLEANYFAEKLFGVDHELRFGFDRNYARYIEEYMAPNQMFVDIFPASATQDAPYISKNGLKYWGRIRTYCDRYGEKRSERTGIFAQDIMTYGRFAFYVGVRFDWHAWAWEPTEYHALAPADEPITQWDQWTGAFKVPGGKKNIGATFSPRFSITWDMFGTGKDLIKFQFADYSGALDNLGFRNGFKAGYMRGEFSMPFIDLNGNYVPDWPTAKFPNAQNEFFLNDILGHWPTPTDILNMIAVGQAELAAWNAAHPGQTPPWNYFTYPGWFYLSFSGDPLGKQGTGTVAKDDLSKDFVPDRVMEMSLSYEKQLTTEMSLTVVAAYKKEYDFPWWRPYSGTLSNPNLYPPDTTKYLGTDPITGRKVWGADPAYPSPTGYIGYVYKYYYNYFKGAEVIFRKLLSHGWMLQASLDLEDWRVHYSPTYRSFDDLTNTGAVNEKGEFGRSTLYDYYNKGYAGVYEYASTEPRQNARWHFKIAGLVQLPLGFDLSGFVDARDGYIINKLVSQYSGQTLVETGIKYGHYRLPNFWYANLTLDKTFKFSDQVVAKVFVTAYNVFNNVVAMAINQSVVPTPWPPKDYPTDVNRPRIVQIGMRFTF